MPDPSPNPNPHPSAASPHMPRTPADPPLIGRHRPAGLGALVLTALVAAGPAAADNLRIAISGEPYPPFYILDASGKWGGWEVDLAQAVCAKIGATCEIVPTGWDGIIPALQAKKFDAIAASMSITPERQKVIDFSAPYYNTPSVIVCDKSYQGDASPAALAGKAVGVQQSTTHDAYAQKYFAAASTLKVYQTQDEANQDLIAGRIDCTEADLLAMDSFIKTDGKDCCTLVGPVADDPAVLGTGIGFGLRKEDGALRDRLTQGIADIKADGTYKAITDKYFDVDISGDAPAK